MQQILSLHKSYDDLQKRYGDPLLNSVYGAGEIVNPKVMFLFMNPTGRNISSNPNWNGLRAPWIGTKQVWDIFDALGLISVEIYKEIKCKKPQDWSKDFSNKVYKSIASNSVYITNLAKCTQIDARPLSNKIFKEYLKLMYEEIQIVNPNKIISFGNQVSSILLGKQISVSNYHNVDLEVLNIEKTYSVYPTYYPVGQGRRNMSLAIERIKYVLDCN